MELQGFALIVLAAGLASLLLPLRWSVFSMFAFAAFGGSAALSLPALGGATVTPANLFLPFYVIRMAGARFGPSAVMAVLSARRAMFVFLLLTLWALLSALFLPRLFEGAVQVFALTRSDDVASTVPLRPTAGNISQAVYAMGAFFIALTTCCLCTRRESAGMMITALCLVSAIDIFFGLLDLVSGAVGLGFLFDALRNGGYAFLTDADISGVRRVTGLMPEASAFALFSLQLFAANVVLFVKRVRVRFTGPASIVLALLIAASTSSAGYVGLAGFAAVFGAVALFSFAVKGHLRSMLVFLCGGFALLLAVMLIALFNPAAFAVAQSILSDTLLQKASSDSAIERGSWNTQAWSIFLDTHGLGAGIGSTRASNYALVLLSNLGLIGFLLFAALVARALFAALPASHDLEHRAIVQGARAGIAVALLTGLFIGTVYDLGTSFYCLLGICLSAEMPLRKPRRAASAATVAPTPVTSRMHLKEAHRWQADPLSP